MQTNTPPKATNPLGEHAFGLIRASGYLSAAGATLFLATLSFTPHSLGYWCTAAAGGAVTFPLLWRYWCRPDHFLFLAIIMLLALSRSSAERAFFPGLRGCLPWPLFVQYFGLYFCVELSLVFVFRRRLRESVERHSTIA